MPAETRPARELPFTFERRVVPSEPTPAGALVMTPRRHMVFDGARVESAATATGFSPLEQGMLHRIESRAEDISILILRAADDTGLRLWEFDPAFSEDELAVAGRAFLGALLPFYRRVLSSGVALFVHSEWSPRDLSALREAVAALPKTTAGSDADLSRLDSWIVHNLLMYSSLPLDHVLERLLPNHIGLLSRRAQRAKELFPSLNREPPQ